MENYLMSEEDLLREKLNSVDFDEQNKAESSNVAEFKTKFTFFLLQLLDFAYAIGFISLEERNEKTDDINVALIEITASNASITNNYMYVMSLYLHSMSNWNAFQKAVSITNLNSAIELFMEASTWFRNELKNVQLILESLKKYVSHLKNSFISNEYFSLLKTVENYSNFSRDKIRFKTASEVFCNYILLAEVNERDLLNALKKYVEYFVIEIHILNKTNAGNFFSQRQENINAISSFSNPDDAIAEAEKEASIKLNELKAEHLLNIENSEKINSNQLNRLDEIEEEVRNAHPEFSEEEVEEEADKIAATDEIFRIPYQDTLELEKKYESQKEHILLEMDKKIKMLSDNFSKEHRKLSDQSIIFENNTLSIFVKEAGFYQLFQKGYVDVYPDDLISRTDEILKIPLSLYLKEFLSMIPNIEDDEIDYLQSLM